MPLKQSEGRTMKEKRRGENLPVPFERYAQIPFCYLDVEFLFAGFNTDGKKLK